MLYKTHFSNSYVVANTHQMMLIMLQLTAITSMVLLTPSDGGAIEGEIVWYNSCVTVTLL